MLVRVYVRQGLPGPPPKGREVSTRQLGTDRAIKIASELILEHMPVEIIDVDSPTGTHLAQVYDVTTTPRIQVLRDNGSVVKEWMPDELPTSSGDVRYFVGPAPAQLIDTRAGAKAVIARRK